MARSGYNNVSIEDDYFEPLKERAEKHQRSIAGELRAILDDAGIGPSKKKVPAQ